MNEYQSENESVERDGSRPLVSKNEVEDRPSRKEIRHDSNFGIWWRAIVSLVLNFWLIFLFAVATISVVGCLSAHVFQSRLNHVLYNRTVNEKEHIFLQYLKLRETLPKLGIDSTPSIDGVSSEKDIEKVASLLAALEGKASGSDLLYLARSEMSLSKICIPGIRFCLSKFIQLPEQFLELILTISMGVLGSLMRITRNYFDKEPDEEEALAWYIFRPFLGAITALAVLILLKAGQLTISNPSDGAGPDGLNPFFISFIAIISGFLSVQAHDRIRRAGAAIFGTAQPRSVSRWLVQSRLKSLGSKDLVSLASYLGVSEEKVQRWFELQEPVPEPAQPIVAAWLDEPQRILFTDLKPGKRPAPVSAPPKACVDTGAATADTPNPTLTIGTGAGNNSTTSAEWNSSPVNRARTRDRWLISDQVLPLVRSRRLAALAHHAGVDEDTVNAWLENQAPVPADLQRIVEAWFDAAEGSTLFTDIKPRPREQEIVGV